MNKVLPLILVLVVGFGGIFWLSKKLEIVKPKADETRADDDLYFSAAELAAAGHDFRGLIADWYWINSLQYLGGKILAKNETANINDLKPLNPRLLYPMLDAATTLDPKFITVYTYGATVLPAIDDRLAVKLIEKGIAANPDEWRLYNNLGYIYWQMKDYRRAAEIYGAGAEKTDAPVWMKQMGAKMLTEGASRDFALQVYRQMSETAADEQTRTFAELRFMQIESFNELDAVQPILQSFKEKTGRCPNDWNEVFPLLKAVKLPGNQVLRVDKSNNPVDPTGVPYVLNSADCVIALDAAKSKIPQS